MGRAAEIYIMTTSAEKAAVMLLRDFGELEKLQVSSRGCANFVASSRKGTTEKLRHLLSIGRPAFSFLSGVGGETDRFEFSWVVDPINGCRNFMRGVPYFATNIAMMEKNSVVAGVTFDAIRGDCYKSEIGGGAFIRRQRLRVSGKRDFSDAVVAVSGDFFDDSWLSKAGFVVRRTGAVALDLAYLSAGKYDCVVANSVGFNEIAPGILLVKESGGFVEHSKSVDGMFSIIAASSANLLRELCTRFGQNK